ncbi:MAG: hypothetical protein RL660_1748 [Bacteroidota bacterium]|jgi:hypothetical protein
MNLNNEHALEPKSDFFRRVKNYYSFITDTDIPKALMQALLQLVTDTVYSDYSRFWQQYPKSRKRYSMLKIEDLEHPFIQYSIIDFLKVHDFDNYKKYSLIILKKTKVEFEKLEITKYQYETK